MANRSLCAVVNNAISYVLADFQNNPERFWNERDIHWSLFHYLKRQNVSKEAYPTELIRAEFPTLKVFPGKHPARGHYDLVILNAESVSSPEVQTMKAQAPWEEYLKLVQIDVAIEIKLWLNRLKPENMRDRADWDIQKLTDTTNNVQSAYFLNFVQLNFKSRYMRDYYRQLRDYLKEQKKNHKDLYISCIPSDSQIQDCKANWL